MQLALIGVSHKTAPVEIRERLAFPSEKLRAALEALMERAKAGEAMILSTCNRVEIVAEGTSNELIRQFLYEYHRIGADAVSDHLYCLQNAEAIRHVFRVTSSLDSMMIGEPQILGQVKEAYRIANDAGAIGTNLSALMNKTFAVAKRVRSETGISQSAVSISYAAGFKAVGTLVYSWPDAYKKARAADRILRERLDRLGLKFDAIHSEFVGVDACHGEMSGSPSPDIAEVALRLGVRSMEKAPVERFLKELVPIALNGPPSVTGLNAGRTKVDEIVAYWPALIPKNLVAPQVLITSV